MLGALLQRHSVHLLLVTIAGLLSLGIVMLFSTSAFAQESHGDIYYFVKRQSLWLVIGIVFCIAAALTDYHFWQRTWWIWFSLSILLLALCFAPHVGQRINGSSRWVNLGITSFQPSETAKFSAVFFLAWWFSRFERKSRTLLLGFMAPAACVSVLLFLIALEVDLGTTALVGCTMFAVMFAAGASLWILAPLVLLAIGGVLAAAMHIEERAGRLLAFLHPERYRLGEGLQQFQALIAFGSGGIQGLGLGEGRQKMLYLPYAHTDFIFPMIGEELGLTFTLLTVLCYMVILVCGCVTAIHARDRFGTLLAFGLVVMISLQAIVNIGVTTSMLPNKGMPLPFISSGGSNLASCLFMIGILVNIHRNGTPAAMPLRPFRMAARVTQRL